MEKKTKVLIADDEERNRILMQDILKHQGYEVSLAQDGEEALQKTEETPPDVILLDLLMPKIDGFEVMEKLKGDDRTMIIPIVIVTGLGEVKDRVRALQLGADDFLTKPVDRLELIARVRSLVKVKAYNDHMRDYQKELEVKVAQRTEQLRQTYEELQRQNEFLSIVMESLAHPFYVIDAGDYTIKMANKAANLGGLSGNQPCYKLTHKRSEPCEGEEHLCPLREVKKTKKPAIVEHIHYDKDGNTSDIEVHCYPIFDGGGNVVQVIEYCLDITERKRAEEELKRHRDHLEKLVEERTSELKKSAQELAKHRTRLEAIFGSVKDAIITVDTELRVIAANKTTKDICGASPEGVIGKVFTDCLGQCDKACHEVLKETLKSKGTVKEYQIECKHQHRPKQTVMVTSSPLLDGEGTFMGVVLVIRDITRISDLERELRERHTFRNIIGKSRRMQDIYGLLEDLTDLETTVLVTGESGTGKELVAKALHYSGSRSFKPMVTVNCSALAENLLESELFGHVKGAFTGAIRDKQGRFQAAHEGTILLDEIGDISPKLQAKLLRVLQEKEFERVGESTSIKVDVRIIASTNRNLREKIKKGEFREDLYYRLKVVEIELPPIRERLEDIPLLVDHFCQVFNKGFKKNIEGLSEEVLRAFMDYSWPGNVRELEHAIEHAFVLCRGRVIMLNQIPSEIREYRVTKRPVIEKMPPAEELQVILEALDKTGWNVARAARMLGVGRQTLYRKFSKFNLTKPPEKV